MDKYVNCSLCGVENDINNEFCPHCGVRLNKKNKKNCSNCGFETEGDSLFCPKCGSKLIENKFNPNNSLNLPKKRSLFKGRINRKIYILGGFWVLIPLLFFLPLIFFNEDLYIFSMIVVSLINIIISFSLTIRRLHDLNMSGWWSLVFFIPFANILLGLYLIFAKGTDGKNRYGYLYENKLSLKIILRGSLYEENN